MTCSKLIEGMTTALKYLTSTGLGCILYGPEAYIDKLTLKLVTGYQLQHSLMKPCLLTQGGGGIAFARLSVELRMLSTHRGNFVLPHCSAEWPDCPFYRVERWPLFNGS